MSDLPDAGGKSAPPYPSGMRPPPRLPQAASSIMNMFLIGIPAACVAAFAYLQRRPQAPAAAAAGYGTLPLPTNAFGAGYTVSAHRGAAATRLYSSASANVETSKR